MENDPPVAQFVAGTFDDECLVGGDVTGRRALLGQVGNEVGCRARIETRPAQSRGGIRFACAVDLASECPDGLTEFSRTTEAVALPEREAPRLAESRCDEDAIVGDLLDLPAGGTEGEDIADAGLVDHFLIEFTDP